MPTARLWWVGVYALAMAYLEAATVVYLRRVYGITDLLRDVMPYDARLAAIEVGREAATLVMLLAVGWAVGRSRQARLGVTLFAFGLWDVLYYGWLRALLGWPRSPLDPDILFYIPLPWWGPVLAPLLIATLAVVCGALLVIADGEGRAVRPRPFEWGGLALGTLVVLYTFMADSLAALPASAEALSRLRPGDFDWPVYLAGLAAMALSSWRALRRRAPAS
ncbi:MAG TPA: hypothetical protein VFT43_15070 [Candidatus Polarisedimenticolia bacterium]|nr:hypothetical protein [Candidatus Polarisedimenticolia bacterium]